MRILATHRALFGIPRGVRGTRTLSEEDITKVVGVFEATKARWALAGAHAVALLTEPRSTVDFDFIVEGEKLDAILHGLTELFGDLRECQVGAELRLEALDIDLICSSTHPLFQEALDGTRTVGKWSVLPAEMMIALKFFASVGPRREQHPRGQDTIHIMAIVEAAGSSLDRERAIELSKQVYPGAEVEFRNLLDKIDRGERLAI